MNVDEYTVQFFVANSYKALPNFPVLIHGFVQYIYNIIIPNLYHRWFGSVFNRYNQ
jgi:hypothetical protein